MRRSASRLLALVASVAMAGSAVGVPSHPAFARQASGVRAAGDDQRRHASAGGVGSVDDSTPIDVKSPSTRLDQRLASVPTSGGTSTVEVLGDDTAIATAVAAAGGTLGRGGGGLYLATVPNASLTLVADAKGVTRVQPPVRFADQHPPARLEARGSVQSRNATDVAAWNAAGYKGAGSKVGVIALFDSTVLANEIASGELPAIPTANRTCISAGAACPFGTPNATWGNSLAEIVADGAPDAQLYLAELGYRTDYYPVIDWMAANGVTILLNPEIWTYDGPGDGTGPSAAIVDYAVSKGMTWINTAGELGPNNAAPTYWRSTWSDPDNDRLMNFKGTDESLTVYCGFLLGLRWNDWGKPLTDYDLLISDYYVSTRSNGTKKVLSGNNQALPGAQPLEGTGGTRLCNTNPAYGPVYDTNKDGYVSLWVQRSTRTANSPTGDIIEIGTYYGWMEHFSTGDGSVAIAFADSANPGMLTVGGDNSGKATYAYSGYGPTNDGRNKPDLRSYMCLATSVDGGVNDPYCIDSGYYGADAAAAAVAGIAAVAGPAMGTTTPAQLALYVRDQGRVYGEKTTLPDSWQGYGQAGLPSLPPTAYPATTFVASPPRRIIDTRPAPVGPIGLPSARKMRAGETMHLKMTGGVGAVVLNVAMVRPNGRGYLSLHPSGWAVPGTVSAVNAEQAGQVRANTVIVPIGDGYVDLYSSVETDVIVDVMGVFQRTDTNDPSKGRFVGTTPTRMVDSRTCVGLTSCAGTPLPAASWTTFQVRGWTDPLDPTRSVPDDATGVAIAVTVDQPAANGYLSVVPGNVTTASTSNLNFEAGKTATITAFVSIDDLAAGAARLYLSASAHVQIEIFGWFSGAVAHNSEPAGRFVPVRPFRSFDSRLPAGSQPVAAGTVVDIDSAAAGVPTDAAAVFINNAAVNTVGPGEAQFSATAQSQPPAFRNLSAGAAGQVIAASTITRLDHGHYRLSATMSSHFISDIGGYFTDLAPPATNITYLPGVSLDWGMRSAALSEDGELLATVPLGSSAVQLFRRSTGVADTFTFSGGVTHVDLDGAGSTVFFDALVPSTGSSDHQVVALDLGSMTYEAVSVDSAEHFAAGGYSWLVNVTADGSKVLFATTAALDPADTVPNSTDYYLRDRVAGTTTWLPMLAGPNTLSARLSDDGSTLVWAAPHAGSGVDLHVRRLGPATESTVALPAYPLTLDMTPDGAKLVVTYPVAVNYFDCGVGVVDTTSMTFTAFPIPDSFRQQYTGAYSFFNWAVSAQINADGTELLLPSSGDNGIYLISAQGQVLGRVDRTWRGFVPDQGTLFAAASNDLHFVAFGSAADNIVPGLTTTDSRIYLANLTPP